MRLLKNTHKILILLGVFLSSSLWSLEFSSVETPKYNIIYASGRIQSGDLYRFKKVYYSLPSYNQTVVILKSNGGEMQVGIDLGKFFYNHKIATAVKEHSKCVSSCALAFLGGRDIYGHKLRILPRNSRLGFHNFYYKNSAYVGPSKIQRDLNSVVEYFSYVDAPNKLMHKMLKTKPTSVFWITNRRNKHYLATKKISIEKEIRKSVYSENNNIATYFPTKKEAIKKYFQKINDAITLNSDYQTSTAFNLYKHWLSKNLSYVLPKKIRVLKRNRVKVFVTYYLKNNKKIYSHNTYTLKKTKYGWVVKSKRIKPLKKFAKLVRNIQYKLP